MAGTTSTTTPAELDKARAAGTVFVQASDGLHLRATPSLDDGATILALMPGCSAFKITGNSRPGFAKGTFNGQTGWAFIEFLNAPGLAPGTEVEATVVSAEGLNLRAEPRLESNVVALMPNGAKFKLTGESRIGFLEGTFNSQHGWAMGEYLGTKHCVIDDGDAHAFTKAMRDAGMVITQGPFQLPTHKVCNCYDFGVDVGTPIFPIAGGTVVMSEATDDVYRPNKIMIRTQQLGDHLYAHLSERLVNVGDHVTTNTLIGKSGSENGPHLHLQLDKGFSPLGLNLTQTLLRQGFDVRTFPKQDGVILGQF